MSREYSQAGAGRRGVGRRFPLPHVNRGYVIFGLMSFAFALTLFERMALPAIGKDLMAAYDLNAGQLGTLASSYFYVYAVMQLPVGVIVERLGTRRLVATFLLFAAAGSFIFAFAPSYGWLVAGRALLGLGGSVIFVSTFVLMASWFPLRYLPFWNGLFFSLSQVGTLFAGRPLVELARHLSWSGVFVACGVITLILALLISRLVQEAPDKLPAMHQPASSESAGAVLRQPMPWLMGLGLFLALGGHTAFQGVWAGPYLADVYGLPAATVGNLLMLMPLFQIIGNTLVGILAARLAGSAGRVASVGLVIYMLLWIPLALKVASFQVGGLALLYGSLGLVWPSFSLMYPTIRTRYAGAAASTAVGLLNLMAVVGTAVLQQGFGALLNRFTPLAGAYPVEAYRLTFTVGLGVVVLGVLCLLAGMQMQPFGWKFRRSMRAPLP